MTTYTIEESTLIGIADAIRSKTGSEDKYTSAEMAEAIEALESKDPDCNGMHVPEEALVITGDCKYLFSNNKWSWFIEQYGDRITTKDISSIFGLFQGTTIDEMPFEFNCVVEESDSVQNWFQDTFTNARIGTFPTFNLKASSADSEKHRVYFQWSGNQFSNMKFPEGCITKDDAVTIVGMTSNTFSNSNIEEEPKWLFDMCDWDRSYSVFGSPLPVGWQNTYYIKTIPSLPKFWNNLATYYSPWYSLNFTNCYSLQEIILPRPGEGVYTSTPQGFASQKFTGLASLKRIVFDTQEDGTPYKANWKNVTIGFADTAVNNRIGGVSTRAYNFLNPDKCVTDEESYQRLKNDPEYWSNYEVVEFNNNYTYFSAFNHDASLALIRSLPDTTEYIAANGGVNTLKMHGDSGEGTDAGAINTLTEEEIAVAAAKGWTVTLT